MHKLLKKEYINPNLFKIFFEKKNLEFIPGQHFSLSIPGKSINREYSSYTSPKDKEIGFLVRRVEGGIMTNLLDKMEVGEEINIYGPYGSFVLKDEYLNSKQIIFIASGTGVAPFVSIKKSFVLNNYKLFVGIREKKDIADSDIFSEDKSFYSISREKDLYQNNHYIGRVNAQLKNIEFIENYQNSIYMICGNSYMISDVYDILVKEKNINPNSIITESFF